MPRLPRSKEPVFLCLALCVATGIAASCTSAGREAGGPREAAAGSARASRAVEPEDLYARHCAFCHGVDGDGSGPAADYLDPAPRDFGTGRFALASTTNGVPSDDDLVRTLSRGMPGSAMPSWGWMSETELHALAVHVRALATRRMTKHLQELAQRRAWTMTTGEARRMAEQRLTAGEPIEPGPAASQSDATLARGKRAYLEHCAACHGIDGGGRTPVEVWQDTYDFKLARDFTAGIMKGGTSHRELTARIVAGMPASGMPPTRIDDPRELAALVAYTQSLIPAGAESRLCQTRRIVRAHRVEGSVPQSPADLRWERHAATSMVLAPLQWHDGAIVRAEIACLHDGSELAVRVAWEDSSCDDLERGSTKFADAAALQLSAEAAPPLFGMGSPRHPVNIWHWKAFRFRDVAGMLDLLDRPPHAVRDAVTGERSIADVPLYVPVRRRPPEQADVVRAEGIASLSERRRRNLTVDASSDWRNGKWEVVFRRKLAPASALELALAPSTKLQLALALWNGARGKGARGKSVTIWHELELER